MQNQLAQLRKDLHRHPELSGNEPETARRIISFISTHYQPDQMITNIGGHGLAFVYGFSGPGPTVMIRCELDALPIHEPNDFWYRSTVEDISHKCGHDGHMAILAGLASWLRGQVFSGGKVVLFFQSAEETGKGAAAAIQDERFRALRPDYVFALHNIPGAPLHQVILTPELFSATVQSLTIFLAGKESHASEPEHGVNPAYATAELIQALARLNVSDASRSDFALLTPVHLALGQKTYGISPGAGELHYTLRTWSEGEMTRLKTKLEEIVRAIAVEHGLAWRTDWFEYFPATVNDAGCCERVKAAAQACGLHVVEQPTPFRFGEDFGWFSQHYRVAMFGLGAGEDCPALHHADYDFPNALLPTGVRLFGELITELLG